MTAAKRLLQKDHSWQLRNFLVPALDCQVVTTVDPFGYYVADIEAGLNDAFVQDAFAARVNSVDDVAAPGLAALQNSEAATSVQCPSAMSPDRTLAGFIWG